MKEWIIKGINDDEDVCSLCGKQNLNRVVWLENSLTGEIVHVGTICAAKLQKITVKEQKSKEKGWLKQQIENAKQELMPLKKSMADAYWAQNARMEEVGHGLFGMERWNACRNDDEYRGLSETYSDCLDAFNMRAQELARRIGCKAQALKN